MHPDIPYSTDTASASHDEPDPTMDTDIDQLDTSPTPVVQAVSTQPRSDILVAYATASGTCLLFKSLISKIDENSLTSKGPAKIARCLFTIAYTNREEKFDFF